MPEVADGESQDEETAVPSVSPPKPRMPGQRWTLAPGSLLRPAGCSAWEDFRGAGAALTEVKRQGKRGLQTTLTRGRQAVRDSDIRLLSRCLPCRSPAESPLPAHVCALLVGTPLSLPAGRCPWPAAPSSAASSPSLVLPGYLHCLVHITSTLS